MPGIERPLRTAAWLGALLGSLATPAQPLAQSRDGGAGIDAAAATAPRAPDGVLVAAGETIADLDTIIAGLDRRAPVNAVAFAPDGTLVASGAEDTVVRIWQAATGRLLRRLAGHGSAVTAVAFSPDGRLVASASKDRTVRLWDARSGRLVRSLQGHVYHVYAIAFHPRQPWLATASWDRTIQLWDLGSGGLVKKLRGHTAAVRALAFGQDGTVLASGSDDRTVRLWSLESGAELASLAQPGPVTAVAFRPDGEWLFAGSTDGSVDTLRMPRGAIARRVGSCGGPVYSLAVSTNGQILAGACGGGGRALWDVDTGSELRRVRAADTRAVAFDRDGRRLAGGATDGTITVDDVVTGRPLLSLSANVAHLDAVAFAPDGDRLAVTSRDGRVLLWRRAGGHHVLARVLAGEPGPMRALAFSPDGRLLAVGEGRKLALWELDAEHGVRRLAGHEGALNAVAFTADGSAVISGADDGTVRLWQLERDGARKVLAGHRGPVRAVAESPDGSVIASASDDETVRTWDASSGRALAVLGNRRGPVTSVTFTSDGKYILAGTQDRTIEVWLAAKGKLQKTMRKELAAGVVALATRGQRIVAASADGALSVWELTGKSPLAQSPAGLDAPSGLALGPDGTTLATASRDGVLRTWDGKTLARGWMLAGSSLARWFACNAAGRCWRQEDGALLGRSGEAGERAPISPSDDQQRTTLVAQVDRGQLAGALELSEGRTLAIPVRIVNRGAHPAYWVSVSQPSVRAAGLPASLLLLPPPPLTVLPPGAAATVVCEVSASAEYENPRPHAETLRLSVESASAAALTLEIPLWIETPHLKLQHLALLRGQSEAVVASLTEVSMAALEPVRLQARLTLEGDKGVRIPPATVEQPFIGQDMAVAFPLPEAGAVDRRSRATVTVRKSTHPVHVWTFAHAPVRVPLPLWAWVLMAAVVLVLGFVIWRTRLWLRARPVGRAGRRIARLAMAVAVGVARLLLAMVNLRATARSLRGRLQRRGVAATFFRLEPETQCSHLARQLGAAWKPVGGAHQAVFELELLGPDMPLDLERVLLAFPTADQLAATLAELAAADEGPQGITAVIADTTPAELARHLPPARRLVAVGKATMGRILRAPQPALAFARVVSGQLDRTGLSLYKSAVTGGVRQPFYGRKSELRRLTLGPGKNHLVIGPHGIGKTRLLDEVYRRVRAQPGVECYYLSLADGDLTTALADGLGMPGEGLLDVLLERLANPAKGKRVVVLCDDADAWATLDAARGGAQLQTLALLAQEHPCSFVLAGFLGLLYAARPVRGRRRFGDLVRLESLDAEACGELATLPMAALGVHYAKAELVAHVVEQSAGMPTLLVAICDQLLARLPPDRDTIERADVDGACKSEAVARTITAWRPRFGLPEPRLASLDQAVMLSAVFKTRFTLTELHETLDRLGVEASASDVQRAADRLVAGCVFEHWLGQYSFRVPLFQSVMQDATLARMVTQASADPRLVHGGDS